MQILPVCANSAAVFFSAQRYNKTPPSRVRAFVDVSNNVQTVYLVAGKVRPSEVGKAISHEIVGHAGLRKLFGENFDRFLDNVYKLHKNEIDQYAFRYRRKPDNPENHRYLTEEFLADADIKASFWQRLLAEIRALLRSIGFNIAFSDRDIENALIRSAAVARLHSITPRQGRQDAKNTNSNAGAGARFMAEDIFIDKIADDFFDDPDKDVQMQSLPEEILTILNKEYKPLVLKKIL